MNIIVMVAWDYFKSVDDSFDVFVKKAEEFTMSEEFLEVKVERITLIALTK